MRFHTKILLVAVCGSVSLTVPVASAAETNRSHTSVTVETNSRSTVGALRLDQSRLERCERREDQIKQMLERSIRHFERKLDVLEKISDRVEGFAEQKKLNPSNYQAIVDDVKAKRLAAEDGLDVMKDANFDCSGDNPKAVLESFHDQIGIQRGLVKAYQRAVRNLIVGVRSAHGQGNSNSNGGRGE